MAELDKIQATDELVNKKQQDAKAVYDNASGTQEENEVTNAFSKLQSRMNSGQGKPQAAPSQSTSDGEIQEGLSKLKGRADADNAQRDALARDYIKGKMAGAQDVSDGTTAPQMVPSGNLHPVDPSTLQEESLADLEKFKSNPFVYELEGSEYSESPKGDLLIKQGDNVFKFDSTADWEKYKKGDKGVNYEAAKLNPKRIFDPSRDVARTWYTNGGADLVVGSNLASPYHFSDKTGYAIKEAKSFLNKAEGEDREQLKTEDYSNKTIGELEGIISNLTNDIETNRYDTRTALNLDAARKEYAARQAGYKNLSEAYQDDQVFRLRLIRDSMLADGETEFSDLLRNEKKLTYDEIIERCPLTRYFSFDGNGTAQYKWVYDPNLNVDPAVAEAAKAIAPRPGQGPVAPPLPYGNDGHWRLEMVGGEGGSGRDIYSKMTDDDPRNPNTTNPLIEINNVLSDRDNPITRATEQWAWEAAISMGRNPQEHINSAVNRILGYVFEDRKGARDTILSDLADKYIKNTSSFERGFNTSLMGQLILAGVKWTAMDKEERENMDFTLDYVAPEAAKKLGAWEGQILPGIWSFGVDIIPFIVTGGTAGLAGRGTMTMLGQGFSRTLAKEIGKQAAKEVGRKVSAEALKTWGGRAIVSAYNLGFYSVGHLAASDIRHGSISSPWLYVETLGQGMASGAALAGGGYFASKVHVTPTNLAKAVWNRGSALGLEYASFVVPHMVEMAYSGELGKEGAFYAMLLNDAAMMGSCKVSGMLHGAKDPSKKKTDQSVIDELKGAGYGELANALQRRNKNWNRVSGGDNTLNLEGKALREYYQLIEDMDAGAKGVNWDTFSALQGAMGIGMCPPGPSDAVMTEKDGKFTVQIVDSKGRPISKGTTFEDKTKAQDHRDGLVHDIEALKESRGQAKYDSDMIRHIQGEACRKLADFYNAEGDGVTITANDVANMIFELVKIPKEKRSEGQNAAMEIFEGYIKEVGDSVKSAAEIREQICEQYGVTVEDFQKSMETHPSERGNSKSDQAVRAYNDVMARGFNDGSVKAEVTLADGTKMDVYNNLSVNEDGTPTGDDRYIIVKDKDNNLVMRKADDVTNVTPKRSEGWQRDYDEYNRRAQEYEALKKEYDILTPEQLQAKMTETAERLSSGTMSEKDATQATMELGIMQDVLDGKEEGTRKAGVTVEDFAGKVFESEEKGTEELIKNLKESPTKFGEALKNIDAIHELVAKKVEKGEIADSPSERDAYVERYLENPEEFAADNEKFFAEEAEKAKDSAATEEPTIETEPVIDNETPSVEETVETPTAEVETGKTDTAVDDAMWRKKAEAFVEAYFGDKTPEEKAGLVDFYSQQRDFENTVNYDKQDNPNDARVVAYENTVKSMEAEQPAPAEVVAKPSQPTETPQPVNDMQPAKVETEPKPKVEETPVDNSQPKDRIDELLDAMGFEGDERTEQRAYYEDKNNAEQFEKDYNDFVGKKAPLPEEEVKVEDKKDEVVDDSQQEPESKEPEIVDDINAPMPTKTVKGKQKVDYSKTTPRRGYHNIYNERGLSTESADKIVKNSIKAAEDAIKAHAKKKPKEGTADDIDEWMEQNASWEQENARLEAEKKYWEEVQNISDLTKDIKEIEDAKSFTSRRDVFNNMRNKYASDPAMRALSDVRGFVPQNLYDACVHYLTSGVRFVWDAEGTRRGLKQQTGWGDAERKKLIAMLSKDGITPEKAVHEIVDAYGADLGLDLSMSQDILNTLLDAISSTGSVGSAHDYVRTKLLEQMRNELTRRLEGDTRDAYDTDADKYYDEQVQQYRDEHPKLEGATDEEVMAAMERERNKGEEQNEPLSTEQPNGSIPNETGVNDDFFESGGEEVPFQKGETAKPEQPKTKQARNFTARTIKKLRKAGVKIKVATQAEAQRVRELAEKVGAQFQAVWHGSGNKFDEFDHSHMGEGEGAQAYGWGTYVTQVEGIAGSYAKSSAAKNAGVKFRGADTAAAIERMFPDQNPDSKPISREIINIIRDLKIGYSFDNAKDYAVKTRRDWLGRHQNALDEYKKGLEAKEKVIERIENMSDEEYANTNFWDEANIAAYDNNNKENAAFFAWKRAAAIRTGNHRGRELTREELLTELRKNLRDEKIYTLKDYEAAVKDAKDAYDFVNGLTEEDFETPKGGRYLYEVEIPDNDGKNYLPYNRPVGDEMLVSIGKELEAQGWEKQERDTFEFDRYKKDGVTITLNPKATGADVYEELSHAFGSMMSDADPSRARRGAPSVASEFLNKCGIVGIEYPAQYRSGGRGDGSKNYVIFNEADAKIINRTEFLTTSDGTIYGWHDENGIHLTEDGFNPDTPLHEYTHGFMEMIRRTNPEKYKRIVSGLRESEVWEEVLNDPEYQDIKGDEIKVASEVASRVTGRENSSRVNSEFDFSEGIFTKANAIAAKEKVKNALKDLWDTVAEWFGAKLDKAMPYDRFARMTIKELNKGVNPDEVAEGGGNGVAFSKGNGTYTFSEKRAQRGGRFYQDSNGNIDLVDIDQSVFDKMGVKKMPFRMTDGMAHHVFEQHGKELGLKDEADAVRYVTDIMTNFDHVRLGRDAGTYIFSIENGRETTGHRSITIVLPEGDGEYMGIRTSGRERLSSIQKMPLLWEKSAVPSATDAVSANVTSELPNIDGRTNGSASNQSNGSGRKDTPELSVVQENGEKTTESGEKFRQQEPIGERGVKKVTQVREPEYREATDYFGKPATIQTRSAEYKVEGMDDTFRSVEEAADAVRRRNPDYCVYIDNEGNIRLEAWSNLLPEGVKPNSFAKVIAMSGGDMSNSMKKRIANYAKREMDQARKDAETLTQELGLDVEFHDDPSEFTGRKAKAKGWYDPKTGKIHVVMGNHSGVGDVMATMLHEGVAHHGLRKLFGEDFDTFLDNVYTHADESIATDINARIDKMRAAAEKNGESHSDDYYRHAATEEYIAELSEDGLYNAEKNTNYAMRAWNWIKAKFMEMLRGRGFNPDLMGITDDQLRYTLWKSHQNLRQSAVEMAKDAVLKEKAGIKDYVEEGEPVRTAAEDNREIPDLNNKRRANIAPDLTDKNLIEEIRNNIKYNERAANSAINSYISRHNDVYDRLVKKYTEQYKRDMLPLEEKWSEELEEKWYNALTKLNEEMFNGPDEELLDRLAQAEGISANLGPIMAAEGKTRYRDGEEGGRDFAAEMRELMRRRLRGEDVTAELEQLRADRRAAEAARSGESAPATSAGGGDGVVPPNEPPTPPEPATPEPAPELPPTGYERPTSPIEIAKEAAIKAVADTKASLEQRNAARRELTASLRNIHKAMGLQKEYDRATVENVVNLCKMMVQSGLIDHSYVSNLTPLFTKLKNATGKQDLTSTVNDIMDVMLKSQERSVRNEIAKLLNTKGTKVDQNGVVTQAGLDIRGQHTMKELSEYMGKGSVIIDNHIAKLEEERAKIPDGHQERIDDIDDKILGSQLAKQFSQIEETHSVNIREAEEDLNFLKERYKAGEIDIKEYTEQKHALENLIRSYRMAQTDALWNQANALRYVVAGGKEGTRNWIEQQKERKNEIRHNAYSDMEGTSKRTQGDPTAMQKIMNSAIPKFFSSSLYTLQTMLKSLGNKHAMGEGYLYNRFFRGWMEQRDAEITEYRDDMNTLNAKAKELTGHSYFGIYNMIKRLPKMTVEYMDGGEMVPHELDQGQLGYAYMVNKMEDGAAALRNMGITEEKMQEISNFLDPKLKEFYDWLQDDFLAGKWDGMNEVHRRMFGADMDRVANYIPLRRDREAGTQKVDISQENEQPLQSTVVGSIIQRVHSNLGIDLKHNNAIDVVANHLLEATHWKHFSEWKRDANTLLSDTTFRNKVKNSTTIYGSGDVLWNRLNQVFQIAGGDYKPKAHSAGVDKAIVDMARTVNTAKVSLRVFTAAKQLLSLPVFATECNTATLLKNLGFLLSPVTSKNVAQNSFLWCLQNLPQFRERWVSRTAGETRLENGDLGWGYSRQKVLEAAGRMGLTPNAFIDVCTVAAGAKSVYEKRFAQYKKDGYSEEAASKKAKIDAETAFNESQQSSEKAFVSPIQVDRTAVALGLSTFRNASMGFERKFIDAIRNFRHLTDHKDTVEFMKKQMERDGLTETQAKSAAERLYRRALWRSTLNFLMFGFGAQMAWNVGGKLPYLIFGDNDEEKKKIIEQAAIHAGVGGWIEGMPAGDMLSEGMTNWAMNLIESGNPLEGNSFFEFDPDLLTVTSDFVKMTKAIEGKNPLKGATDFINLLAQIYTGVNPQTLTDAGVAIYDACNGDPEVGNEALMCVLRIMQCPQSQLDQMYIDELKMSAREAQNLTPEEVARRYAYYKAHKDTPYMWWMYNQGKKDEIVKKYEGDFYKKLNTDVKEEGGTAEDYHDLMESSTTKKKHDEYKKKEIDALAAQGPEALMKAWDKEHAKGASADYKYMRTLMSRYQKEMYGEEKMPADSDAAYEAAHGEDLEKQAEKIGRDFGFEAQDSYYQMSQTKTKNSSANNKTIKEFQELGGSFRYTENGEFLDMDEYNIKLPVKDKAKRAKALAFVEEHKPELQRIYRNGWRMKRIASLYKELDSLEAKRRLSSMLQPTSTMPFVGSDKIYEYHKEISRLLDDEAGDRDKDNKSKKK